MRIIINVIVLTLGFLTMAVPPSAAAPTPGHPILHCQERPHGKKCGGNQSEPGGGETNGGDNNTGNGQVNPQCYYNCTHGKGALGDKECTYSCQQ